MKKWRLVVTVLYAVVVIGLLALIFMLLLPGPKNSRDFIKLYQDWGLWIVVGVFVLIQFTLLSLSVDTSQKRMRSRTPIVITAVITGLLLMIVTTVVVLASIVVVIGEKKLPDRIEHGPIVVTGIIGGLWVVWGIVFYLFYRNSADPVTRALSWLFRGSVLELLVALPSHVIVRRRDDCCAPVLTAFGITTGIAIMMLSFGPSVLLLFIKRMERYSAKRNSEK